MLGPLGLRGGTDWSVRARVRSAARRAAQLRLAVDEHVGQRADPAGARGHAVRRDDEVAAEGHAGVVGRVLDEARRLELQLAKVALHLFKGGGGTGGSALRCLWAKFG